MPRERINSMVDESLLQEGQRAETDRAYGAYDEHPIDEPDEWGDLWSFRAAAR